MYKYNNCIVKYTFLCPNLFSLTRYCDILYYSSLYRLINISESAQLQYQYLFSVHTYCIYSVGFVISQMGRMLTLQYDSHCNTITFDLVMHSLRDTARMHSQFPYDPNTWASLSVLTQHKRWFFNSDAILGGKKTIPHAIPQFKPQGQICAFPAWWFSLGGVGPLSSASCYEPLPPRWKHLLWVQMLQYQGAF